MIKKTFALIVLIIVVGGLLSGCATGLTPASWPGVTADDKTAYLSSGLQIYAVKLSNGRELWRFPEKANRNKMFYAAPTLTPDGQLIVGGFDTILYSLDPDTGEINWTFEEAGDRWIGSVLVANDFIYAPSADYTLYALNLAGALQWTFQAEEALWSAPVSDGQKVYLASLDHKVYALDAQSGDEIWSTTMDGAVLGSPVLASDGRLYVGTFGGTLFALGTDTGKVLWQASASSWIWSSPVQDGEYIYVGDAGGEFFSFTLADGRENWQVQPNGPVLGSPLVIGDLIVFGTESGSLYAYDRQGDTIWEKVIGGKLYGTPVIAGDLILVAPIESDSILVAYDQSGTQEWAFTPGTE